MKVYGSWASGTAINDLEYAASLEEFKRQQNLDISDSSEDDFLGLCLRTAIEQVEAFTNRALISRSFTWYLDSFPGSTLYLPMNPVSAVASVKYYDRTTETLTTWASSNYVTDFISEPARIVRADGITYPTLQVRPNAVEIAFTAGYGDDYRKVNSDLKMCALYLAGLYYTHREPIVVGAAIIVANLPFTYEAILLKNRIFLEV